MNLDILRNIGLTDGEIKVYNALIELGQSPIFKIIKRSKVSSSKVYLILDKLIQRGMVSFVIEEKTKKFQITNPESIIDLTNKKKEELDHFKEEFNKIIPQINNAMSSVEEESAQVYKGIRGMRSAFENLLAEIKPQEEYCFFSVSKEELDKKSLLFFKNYHKKRAGKKVKVRGIIDSSIEDIYKKEKFTGKYSNVRHYDLPMPVGMVIGKNRVLIAIFGNVNLTYELTSKRIAEKYRNFFNKIWKISKKVYKI